MARKTLNASKLEVKRRNRLYRLLELPVLPAEDAGLPSEALARWAGTAGSAGLVGVVVLADSVECKIVGGIDYRGGVFSETRSVLLVSSALHDRSCGIEGRTGPGKYVEPNRRMDLGSRHREG